MIRYVPVESNHEDCHKMERNGNLILTGWGYAEYVASAAVALKALGGRADVYGVSRRRLPEFLGELAKERGMPHWKRIYLLGLSLSGDPESLKAALARLKARGVDVTWISALEMPEHIAALLDGLVKVRCYDGSLLEAVGQTFGVDVEVFMPFLKDRKRVSADVRAYFTLIDTAQFHYRNYQDESLYATTARYLAGGVRPAAWEPDVRSAVEHYGHKPRLAAPRGRGQVPRRPLPAPQRGADENAVPARTQGDERGAFGWPGIEVGTHPRQTRGRDAPAHPPRVREVRSESHPRRRSTRREPEHGEEVFVGEGIVSRREEF